MNAVDYIASFSRTGGRVSGLSRIRSLLEALGSPQDGLRFIHVAGTNGKGSIAEMLSQSLIAQGFRTGLFTSPYIISFYDRIRLNGRDIPPSELDRTVSRLAPVVERHPQRESFSQFEITQAAAFLWFAERGCDAVVLEAGLGGLLDSTNVIEHPLVCAIGSIGLDHTAVLGDTIEQIAFQKAGIIKEGCPCVLSAGAERSVTEVFRRQAEKLRAPLVIPDLSECTVTAADITGSSFVYRGREYRTAMAGQHQIRNALTVIEALRLLGGSLALSYESIRRGIGSAAVPARTEVLSREPLVILDGSHNPNAMRALGQLLGTLGGRTVRAVIGMHSDKDAASAVSELVPYIGTFYPVSGFSDRDISVRELSRIIEASGGRCGTSSLGIMPLITELRSRFPNDVLVITGSLYLAAYVRSAAALRPLSK